jgi:hypothetical protein
MPKHDKTLSKITSQPTPSNVKWSDLKSLLESLGYKQLKTGKTGGSRRKFFNEAKNALIICHEPHPSSIVNKGCVADVAQHLKEHGFA